MTRKTRRAQRGVLLLIVLALVMFGMMAVSFVLLAQARRAAELSAVAAVQPEDTSVTDLNTAMHIVLRGDTNPMEPLWPHSLLESLYGNNSTSPTAVTGVSTPFGPGSPIVCIAATGITEPERRVGTVLTMLTQQAVTTTPDVPRASALWVTTRSTDCTCSPTARNDHRGGLFLHQRRPLLRAWEPASTGNGHPERPAVAHRHG